MHIYAFGSVCRGEIDRQSDIDLLAIVNDFDVRFNPNVYSIYSYKRIKELWEEGNPFAWHLHTESKLIYSSDTENFLKTIGSPSKYVKHKADCEKFYNLYCQAIDSISIGSSSLVYELSTIFLSIRNFATCFMLGITGEKKFSRRSAIDIGLKSLPINPVSFDVLERARILSVRGIGEMLTKDEINQTLSDIEVVSEWMQRLLIEVKENE